MLNSIRLQVSTVHPRNKGLFPGAPRVSNCCGRAASSRPFLSALISKLVSVSWDLVSLTLFSTQKNRYPSALGPELLVAVLDPAGAGSGPREVAVDKAGQEGRATGHAVETHRSGLLGLLTHSDESFPFRGSW